MALRAPVCIFTPHSHVDTWKGAGAGCKHRLHTQVILSVSKGAAPRPDSGGELSSPLNVRVRPLSAAERHGSLAGAAAAPEVLVGLKEGDRHLIILDEKQNLVIGWPTSLRRAFSQ